MLGKRTHRNGQVISKQILSDPRLPVYAEPTLESQQLFSMGDGELQWVGVRNGEADENLGSDIDNSVSQLGSIYYEAQNVAVPAEGLIMTYSELMFILAEAAENGWISRNARDYYVQGITGSVNYYNGVDPETDIELTEEYLLQEDVAYAGTTEEKLGKIAQQKWIAMFFNGLQSWFEWRRTGLPELEPSFVNANNDQIPVRFQYPVEQQALNNENYQNAVQRQGDDNINTKVWWDE